jgi:NDP-hexose-3-ketoreductase
VFHDSAGYPVAAALMHISSKPISLSCEQSFDPETGVDDSFALTIKFAGGEIAQLYTAFDVHYRSRYAISGTKGRIELERAFAVAPDMPTVLALETNSDHLTERISGADQFRLMIEDFCATITGAMGNEHWENDLLRLQSVMDAAALSARERRTIEIENL